MSNKLKPPKQTVELRPSRIRRDPVRTENQTLWRTREWENRFAVIGIILFALAMWALSIGISEITSH